MIDEKELIKELDVWWETLDPRTDSTICDVIEAVIEKINDAEKCGEWVPTTERLPEKKGSYLFTTTGYDCARVLILSFDPDDELAVEIARTGVDLAAWMPLPEPYKENETCLTKKRR